MLNRIKKGFTIVELVIVIAVIAILAGVLIPTFSGVVSNARHSAAQQEAKSALESALAMSSNAALPAGTLFMIDSDKDGTFDYCFVYTNNKLSDASFNGTKPYSISFKIGTDDVTTDLYAGYAYMNNQYNYTRVILADEYATTTERVATWLGQTGAAEVASNSNGYTFTYGAAPNATAFDVYVSVDFPEDICVFIPVA